MSRKNNWDYSVFWKEALNQIRSEISEQERIMWFENIVYDSGKENEIYLNVPSLFYKDQIKQRYNTYIEEKLFEISGHKLKINYEVKKLDISKVKKTENNFSSDSKKPPVKINKETSINIEEIRKNSGLTTKYTFESFITGNNSMFAANAAQAIAKNTGTAYNPCLIYGGVGLGKTHLIQSIGNASLESNPSLKITYVTAETFTNEFIKLIQDKKSHLFKNKYRKSDILLIDDIHFLQGKDATQEELFHTFNALYDSNKQMVFTCDRPVSELKLLTDRLRNRFERGLNVDLQPPDFETRFAILKEKLNEQNSHLSDEIIELICKNITSNVRDLEAAMLRLVAYAELVGKEITMKIAEEQLRDAFSNQQVGSVSMEVIQRTVADYFNISNTDIKGKKRNSSVVLPRQIAMYIAREITEYSTTEIGADFGGRDHTTVMHSCQKIENMLKTDSTLEPTLRNLIRIIKEQEKAS